MRQDNSHNSIKFFFFTRLGIKPCVLSLDRLHEGGERVYIFPPTNTVSIHTLQGVCICIADVFGSISVLQTEWTGSSPVRYSISKGTVGKNFLSGYYEPQKKEDFCSKKVGLPFPFQRGCVAYGSQHSNACELPWDFPTNGKTISGR